MIICEISLRSDQAILLCNADQCGEISHGWSQEEILRDSGYPSHGVAHDKVVEVPMPDNFWGLKPPQ